ncbi:hypothetical protein WICPIJ_008803 [Wickerhamomyces pijperi]|uniref:non-specific serine/threonine protein kinase n=1 Tax=Wickerhamomyces pijperi TaxID=599730 RepID=A0A9P8THT2_WICPI|nr:hypothetical protein WICPIJ_008803 [Wickerhamomyces pijperi]
MSLVLYGDSTDSTQLSSSSDSGSNHGNGEYNVILDNRYSNTLVLHNKYTDELVLMNNNLIEMERTCPHCGSNLKVKTKVNTERHGTGEKGLGEDLDSLRRSERGDNLGSIHANYFRLLENSIDSRSSTPFQRNGNSQAYEEEEENEVDYFLKASGHQLPSSIFQQGYFSNFFKLRELLGKGSRGSVYKVEHFLNDVSLGVFALKKITIGDDPKWLLKVLNEVSMLVKISYNNKNLVNYNHVWLEIDSINDFGPKVPCAFILQQYCSGGSLETFVTDIKSPVLTVKEMKQHRIKRLPGRFLTNEEILLIFTDLVNGVSELHKNHIIHRDLKPSNCLMSHSYLSKFELGSTTQPPDLSRLPTALIGDFGESQLEGELRTASGYTGTIEYTAPELFVKKNQFSKKTDVYSLGMILYFLCFSGVPFIQVHDLELLKEEIINFKVKDQRPGLHPQFLELIKSLTDKQPQKRPDSTEVLQMLHGITGILGKDHRDTDTTDLDETISEFDEEFINDTPAKIKDEFENFHLDKVIRSEVTPDTHDLLDDNEVIKYNNDQGNGDEVTGKNNSMMSNYVKGRASAYLQKDPTGLKIALTIIQLLILRYMIATATPQYQTIHLLLIFVIGFLSRGKVRDSLVCTLLLGLGWLVFIAGSRLSPSRFHVPH